MRVLRDEFFIRKDFAFYDSCVAAAVPLALLHTYDLIRRFTFRGKSSDADMKRIRRSGFIVSNVGQTKLSEMVGVSRQTVNEYVSKMKQLGWLNVHQRDDRQGAYYVVGQMLGDEKNKQHEAFFADAWMYELWTTMLKRCRDEFGDEAEVFEMDVSWRVAVVKDFIGTLGHKGGGGPVESETTEQVVGCRPQPTGVVGPSRQGLSAPADTEVENSQVENFEVDKGEGPVASLPPSPLSGAEENSPARSFAGKLKVPRRVAEKPTLSESGEYPSVPPPPPAPIPKWMQESPGIAVGDDEVRGPVPQTMSNVHVDMSPREYSPPAPRVPEKLAGIVAEASARARKSAEAQLQKAKARESKLASLGGKPIPVTRKRQLDFLENKWKELMETRFAGTQIAAWEGKERGQVWNLVEKYTGEIVGDALQYLVEQWDEIRTRMLKGRGGVPSVGFLLRFHDVLVVESQRWTVYRDVKKQVDDWYGDDPYKPDPPQELYQRYLALRKEMADLGLPV